MMTFFTLQIFLDLESKDKLYTVSLQIANSPNNDYLFYF